MYWADFLASWEEVGRGAPQADPEAGLGGALPQGPGARTLSLGGNSSFDMTVV